MNEQSELHHRRSIRLKDYDYAHPGAYFVTICTHRHINLFGEITAESTILNHLGRGVEEEWLKTSAVRPNVIRDEFIIMPNYIHGIVMITDRGRGVLQYAPTISGLRSPSQSLGAIVRGFKSVATKRINHLRGTPGRPVWQRNYFEHIIRDEKSLNRIREYI